MSAAPAVAVLAAALGAIVNGLHTIHEGHIGVYWRGGALMERTSGPGVHWRFPLLDRHEEARARAPARARESGRSSSPRPISSPVPLSRLAARRAVRAGSDDDPDRLGLGDPVRHVGRRRRHVRQGRGRQPARRQARARDGRQLHDAVRPALDLRQGARERSLSLLGTFAPLRRLPPPPRTSTRCTTRSTSSARATPCTRSRSRSSTRSTSGSRRRAEQPRHRDALTRALGDDAQALPSPFRRSAATATRTRPASRSSRCA